MAAIRERPHSGRRFLGYSPEFRDIGSDSGRNQQRSTATLSADGVSKKISLIAIAAFGDN